MMEVGNPLPAFSLYDQNNRKRTDKDLLGKKTVLYFYPKDDTPGCTKEACDFTNVLQVFHNNDTEVYGVSRDSVGKHQSFAEKYDLKIALLADDTGDFCESCGVIQEKKMFGKAYWGVARTTFILDEDNKICYVFKNVKVPGHTEAVLSKVTELALSIPESSN